MKPDRFSRIIAVMGVVVAVSPWFSVRAQPLEFVREHVTVSIRSGQVLVDGIYLLRNPAHRDRIQSLVYPFPVDSTHPFPDSVSVTYQQRPVEFTAMEDRILFTLEIPAGEQAGFRVTYRQTCLDSTACYILTTTSYWNQPLKSADFVVEVAAGLVLDWSSYEFEKESKTVGTYTFGRDDFSPDRDLCLRWRSRGPTDTSP